MNKDENVLGDSIVDGPNGFHRKFCGNMQDMIANGILFATSVVAFHYALSIIRNQQSRNRRNPKDAAI